MPAKPTFSSSSSPPFPQTIGISNFAKRYVANENHAHFEGSWEDLIKLIKANWSMAEVSPDNKLAVVVPMPEQEVPRFYSTTVKLSPSLPLRSEFSPRPDRPGEDPYLKVFVPGQPKTQAKSAEIILYRPEALSPPLPPQPWADYYIVAVKAYLTKEREPVDPVTMARNFLEKPGGSKADYSAKKFADAIWYWSQHASIDKLARARPPL